MFYLRKEFSFLLAFFIVVGMCLLLSAEEVKNPDVLRFAMSSKAEPLAFEENGEPTGILVDIPKEAGKRMGIPISVKLYPWVRANELCKRGLKVDALITNGPLRSEWANHGDETVITMIIDLFTLKDHPKLSEIQNIKTFDDLKPFRLVGHRGSGLNKLFTDKGLDLYLVAQYYQVFKLINKGRYDIFHDSHLIGSYKLKQLGLQGRFTSVPSPFMEKNPFTLVISKQSPWAGTNVLTRWDKVIRNMKESGELQKIIDSYIK